MDTVAGTVQPPRRFVGTRTAATSPSAPISTTAVAVPPSASAGPWVTRMTRVHTPSVAHVRFRAYTPSRDVSANSSFTVRRSPFTIPSAVPSIGKPMGVWWWNACTSRNAPCIVRS